MKYYMELAGIVVVIAAVLGLMGWLQYRRWLWWSARQDKKNAPQTLFSGEK